LRDRILESRLYVLGCLIAQRRVVYAPIGSARMRIRSGSKTTMLPSARPFSNRGQVRAQQGASCSVQKIEMRGLPGWLRRVAEVFPVQHLADGLHHAYDPAATGAGNV
jgi:hypothetical protein